MSAVSSTRSSVGASSSGESTTARSNGPAASRKSTSFTGGATDGGAVHLHQAGVPTLYLGVPTRYIHSHAAIMHTDDYDNAVKLIVELVKKLDAKTVKKLAAC